MKIIKPLYVHNLKDTFTQSGCVEELYKFYKLDSKLINKFIIKNLKHEKN